MRNLSDIHSYDYRGNNIKQELAIKRFVMADNSQLISQWLHKVPFYDNYTSFCALYVAGHTLRVASINKKKLISTSATGYSNSRSLSKVGHWVASWIQHFLE